MDRLVDAIVEDFGNGYASFGHSELMGRVVGLLLCAHRPMTLEDISHELHVSKSPVNQICKRLEELQLIRKAWVKGERKFHYQIVDNVFLQASINLSRLNEGNLQIAERHLATVARRLQEAEGEEKERLRLICKRFIEMREFYHHLLRSYRNFIEEWQVARNQLPDVDTYLKQYRL
ncbi:MAG: winged helix-turn-helix transcriptional regulator [candidate division KSB1 bacterium]|nr:winged helix-turn-helix transcriptional regulator [candidate division KSB1 bacterium]